MKKINIFIIDEKDINEFKKIGKNSQIQYKEEENKFYYQSHFKEEKEEIKLKFLFFNIVDNYKSIIDYIESLVSLAAIEAKNISIENFDNNENHLLLITKSLENTLNKYCYKQEAKEDFNMIDIFSEMFLKILTGHYLQNGNKRMALSFLAIFMYNSGYYLKWFKYKEKNWSEEYENKLCDFIEIYDKQEKDKWDKTVQVIKEFLNKNWFIALNWTKQK